MTWQALPWQSSLQAAFTTIWGSGVSPIPSLDLNFTLGSLDPRITYTGASLATLTDATGKIAYKPHNLALYSEDLSNAAYNAFATTVSSGATSPPSGFTSADKLQEGSGIQLRGQSMVVVSGQRYTQICRAKLAERSFLVARNQDSTRWCVVDLSNGTLYNAGIGFGVTITSVGGGWYEVACSFVSGTTGNVEQQWGISANGTLSSGSYDSYTGTAGYGLYITGIQWCQGAKAAYGKTTSAAYYGPRFTYDPVTHAALGLLIEEQRTNLLTGSGNVGGASWTTSGALTVTQNAVAGPAGGTTATRIQTTGAASVYQNITVAASTAYTLTFYALNNGGTLAQYSVYDVSHAANIFAETTYLPSINGSTWTRVTVSFTTPAGCVSVNVYPIRATGSGADLYLDCAQLEAGACATSYIPTTSASVTRAADSATMTGANFSSWFNASAGSFVIDARRISASVYGGVMATDNGSGYSGGAGMLVRFNDAGNVEVGGNSSAVSRTGLNAVGSLDRVAYNYAAGGSSPMNVSANGGSVGTLATTDYTGASVARLIIGGGPNGALKAPISRLRYYNTALTNAQLQALTK